MSGALSYYSGLAAEEQVARQYEDAGRSISEHRWRGRYGGEIDLIARDGDTVIFVEVKKSRSHARAVQRLSSRQMQRICVSVQEYLMKFPAPANCNRKVRFDLALVDEQGQIKILENAYFGM
ncbi:MAG: YraN family protein [Rhodobacteraceae bacterium]|nr:YraN family protein [Paracoccaceae bacterium]